MTTWNPPPDFAGRVVIEKLTELSQRYGVASSTLIDAIKRLPPEVQEARKRRITERKRETGMMGNIARYSGAAKKQRNPVGVTLYRESHESIIEREIRNATIAFELHYCGVADRHQGWPIMGYAT